MPEAEGVQDCKQDFEIYLILRKDDLKAKHVYFLQTSELQTLTQVESLVLYDLYLK